MAERRRGKKKREVDEIVEDDKSQKIEFEVAKYLRSKLPSKRTTLLGHKVDYFIASKAIDCLLDSKWAKNDKGEDAMFTTRDSVVGYMQRMLVHQFFHRAKPIIVSKKDNRKRGDDPPESSAAEDTREKKKDKVKKDKKDKEGEKEKDKSKETSKGEKDDKEEKDESKDTEKDNKDDKGDKEATTKESKEKKEGKDPERKKEKKKVKLDMHLEQIFVDGNHPYVWIYDPIPVKTWFIGALFVIAAIAICLFPLWPKTVRNFVYYLSLAGAGFLLFVFSLVILRFVIFVIIWLLTFGKHNFWILPNLTEDVGVLESFWPLYQYEYKGNKKNDGKDAESKEEEKEKASEEAEDDDKKEKSKEKKEKKKQKTEDDQTGDESIIGDKRGTRKGSKTTEDEDEEDEEEEEEEEERSDEVTEEDGEDAPLMGGDDNSSNPVKFNNVDDNGFEILDVQESS